MKPYIHAQNSVKKWAGVVGDYLELHDWMDASKSHVAAATHRAILHHSFGIFLGEEVFGHNITNSDGKLVSVRDVLEQHVIEDLGFIPSVSDYLNGLIIQPWMMGEGRKNKEKEEQPKEIPIALLNSDKVYIDGAAGPKGGCVPITAQNIFYDGSNLNKIVTTGILSGEDKPLYYEYYGLNINDFQKPIYSD